MRRSEAEKIDTLEDKIKLELVQLDEKTLQMQHSMDGFANVSGQALIYRRDHDMLSDSLHTQIYWDVSGQ